MKVCSAKKRTIQRRVHHISPGDDTDAEPGCKTREVCRPANPPYTITLKIDATPLCFEIDALPGVNALASIPLIFPPASTFHSSTGHYIAEHGLFTAEVEHWIEFQCRPVHVVRKGQQPDILRRNWLNRLPS